MKTIAIDKQESAVGLAQAFGAALANELGWTVENTSDGATVKKEGINIYFKFRGSGSTVYLGVSNGYAVIESGGTSYAADATYNLYVLKSAEGTIAVGHGKTTTYVNLINIIAQNEAGEYVGIALAPSSAASRAIRGLDTAGKSEITIMPISDSGVCTSVVKYPDIWGACMFKDLYAVVSCPYKSVDCVFYLGGKYYRVCKASESYPGIAIPEA